MQSSSHRDGDAFDRYFARVDRFESGVFRLEPDSVLFFEEPFHRRLIVNARDHDLTVRGRLLAPHHQEVSVVDAGVDHAIAADMQDKAFFRAHKVYGQGEIVFDVLLGKNRLPGGDLSDDRNGHPFPGWNLVFVAEYLQRARLAGVPSQITLLTQGRQVAVDRGTAGQPQSLPDLAHRRRVPVGLRVPLHERQDLALAAGQTSAQDWNPHAEPEGLCKVPTKHTAFRIVP